ncbi:hypothetical protein MBLNU459_g7195t1 [Dothideomycetes sp. NU459]
MSGPTKNMQATVEEDQVDAAATPERPKRSKNAEKRRRQRARAAEAKAAEAKVTEAKATEAKAAEAKAAEAKATEAKAYKNQTLPPRANASAQHEEKEKNTASRKQKLEKMLTAQQSSQLENLTKQLSTAQSITRDKIELDFMSSDKAMSMKSGDRFDLLDNIQYVKERSALLFRAQEQRKYIAEELMLSCRAPEERDVTFNRLSGAYRDLVESHADIARMVDEICTTAFETSAAPSAHQVTWRSG